jgi:UDP-3-O-[3-hydroxymyristoyl] glucosamine N-acyltransferase
MRILLTNVQLTHRSGTEIVTRDLALGLKARGHEVSVYSPNLGRIAAEITESDIQVVNQLANLAMAPDIIHGHHHGPTLDALTAFPHVPAIWVCHDRYQWTDIPPIHPNIMRYVAVDLNCRERFEHEANIDLDLVAVINNAIDLNSFKRRGALPLVPQRVAIYSNSATPGSFADAVAVACQQHNLQLDILGQGAGREVADPGSILGSYDLVFAKARCAIEAAATGCAVIILDQAGLGPLVTRDAVANLFQWNFGMRCMQFRTTPELISQQLARYEAQDAEAVCEFIRKAADFEAALNAYEEVYQTALRQFERTPPHPATPSETIEPLLKYTEQLERTIRVLRDGSTDQSLPPMVTSALTLSMNHVPGDVEHGRDFSVDLTLANDSRETLTSRGLRPVHVSYRIALPDGVVVTYEGNRTALQRPIRPGEAQRLLMRVTAPKEPGQYVLNVTLVQESVFWFDELPQPLVVSFPFEVVESGRPSAIAHRTFSSVRELVDGHPGVIIVRDHTIGSTGFVDDVNSPGFHNAMTFALSEVVIRRLTAAESVGTIITTANLAGLIPDHMGLITCDDPKAAFFEIHRMKSIRYPPRSFANIIHPNANIHRRAVLADSNIIIGAHSEVGAGAVVERNTTIGDHTVIEANAIVGSTAFQVTQRSEDFLDLFHAGGVNIGDHCRIFAGAVIARGVFEEAPTTIDSYCRIGNNSFVSHQCRLGRNVFIGHGAVINGRVIIGERSWVGPGAVVTDSIELGVASTVGIGSTVLAPVQSGDHVSGIGAADHRTMLNQTASLRRLGRMR